MKSSSGIVMQADKKHAVIMTSTGEFLKLKTNKTLPKLGEIYTGEVARSTPFYKYALTAATLTFIMLFGSTAYAYYTPVASVTVNINPSIKLDLNRWNKIIKSTPLNEDGKTVLSDLNVKNKSLNDALDSIVNEAKKDNFINTEYKESGKIIDITINSSKQLKNLDLSNFEGHIKLENLNANISTAVNDEIKDTVNISSTSKGKSDKENKEADSKNSKNKDNNNDDVNNQNTPIINEKGNGKNKNENKNTPSNSVSSGNNIFNNIKDIYDNIYDSLKGKSKAKDSESDISLKNNSNNKNKDNNKPEDNKENKSNKQNNNGKKNGH